MTDTAKVAIRASTQNHLEIEDIRNDIVILKDGSACLIISVTSINFDLLSEKEQEATIFAYASLLNSLNFSLQIVVRTQQKDVSSYLQLLDQTAEKTKRPLIKNQLLKYRKFVKETVQKNNVLDKKFFLVIPMSALEIGATKAIKAGLDPKKRKLPFEKKYILEQAKINLYPKRDHLLRQLNRLGIKGQQLETKQLIKLFFDIYNPTSHGQQIADERQYRTPLVQSTLIPPQTEQKKSAVKTTMPSPPPLKTSSNTAPVKTVYEQISNLVRDSN